MRLEEHWRMLNSLARFAQEVGIEEAGDLSELDVWQRWARLKASR